MLVWLHVVCNTTRHYKENNRSFSEESFEFDGNIWKQMQRLPRGQESTILLMKWEKKMLEMFGTHAQNAEHPYSILKWNPSGQRGIGKPRGTWWTTIKREMAEVDKTWNELKWLTQNRSEWWKLICSPASQGDRCEATLSWCGNIFKLSKVIKVLHNILVAPLSSFWAIL